MELLRCLCGIQIEAPDGEGLFQALKTHCAQTHAQWRIQDSSLRQALERRAEMDPWDGRAVALSAEPEIHALGPNRLDDFLWFFDREGFRDNPFWASCYCMEAHFSGTLEEWTRRTTAQNRDDKSALIRSGRAQGFLAYANARPIGWCHAAPRSTLAGLQQDEDLRVDDAERVGAIYCFVIAPPYRRQGLARRLLAAACAGFRTRGLTIAEAYPPRETRSAAGAYRGPLEMYLAAGFQRFRDTPRQVIVRKTLTSGDPA